MTTATSVLPSSKPPRRRLTLSGTVVGVEIGSHSIKLVQLESAARIDQPRVCRVIRHATPLSMHDPEQCLRQIEQTLKGAWSSRNRWCPLPAACALSMRLMEFRSFDRPEADGSTFASSDLQSLFQDDSAPANDPWMVETWQSQVEGTGHGTQTFAALGLRESFARGLAARLWSCGLDCRVIDGMPQVLARATTAFTSTDPVAVIDWGYSTMTLTVVVNGRPYFTRVLPDCELQSLYTALMRPLNLDLEQSQQLLEAYGFSLAESGVEPSNMSAALAELSAPYFTRLGDELRRTWMYLHQMPSQTPKALVLMGGGAMIRSSAALLTQSLPLPARVWSVSTGGSNGTPLSPLYGPALALARLLKS